MDTTIFFILGITLIVSALALAAMGLRNKDFPSPGVFRALAAAFTVLVASTAIFAVLNAEAEHELRDNNNEAAKNLQATDQQAGVQEADNPDSGSSGQAVPPATESQKPAGATATLKVTSPASGELKFDPSTLDTKAGTVTLTYDNPSPVPHSIAIESSGGDILDQSAVGASATFEVTADLQPGTYTYFCTVPGHQQAGMEGKLTVK